MLHSDQYNYLQGLNKQQRIAVETLDGPVLVLSGAGTGKTRVLTTRIAHLLVTGKSKPWNIMAVTFTNKAAKEMRERLENLIGPSVNNIWLGTFHSIAARILRENAELVSLKSNFTIINTDDQKRVMSPKEAFSNGATSIVIGRSITKGDINQNMKNLISSLTDET